MNEVCGSGISSGGGGCLDFGFLLLSLGISIILVGALFYYVRQRFEVLEVSHKEQIGVMQNFIASIGDQFQRMQVYIENKVCGVSAASSEPMVHNSTSKSKSTSDLINVSDNDDVETGSSSSSSESSYGDDDSETSDTASERGGGIKIYDDDDEEINTTVANVKNPFTDNIKIIELNNALDDDDEDDDDEDDDDEDDDEYDDEAQNVQPVIHVIKSDEPQNTVGESGAGGANTRSISVDVNVGDLGLELFDHESFSPKSSSKKIEEDEEDYNDATIQIGKKQSSTSNSGSTSKYAQVSIKQLRQMVKHMDAHKKTDTTKMKREQLVAILNSVD